MGLIQGLVLTGAGREKGGEIVNRLFAGRVLANFAGNAVIRFIPPLIISKEEIDQMIERLDTVLAEF